MNKRLFAIPLAAAAAATIAIVASNSGADFSGSSPTGTITGQTAKVTVIGNDNGSLDISFPGPLVPGVFSTASVTFQNTGNVNEDIYVVFPNGKALHAFDQQGRYAQAYIQADGNTVWASANINDGMHMTGVSTPPAGPYNCSTPTTITVTTPQICPLDNVLLLTNVAPGVNHTFTFGYMMNSKATNADYFVGNSAQDKPFNQFPVNDHGDLVAPTASGLPYQFYAVQSGGAAPATSIALFADNHS